MKNSEKQELLLHLYNNGFTVDYIRLRLEQIEAQDAADQLVSIQGLKDACHTNMEKVLDLRPSK